MLIRVNFIHIIKAHFATFRAVGQAKGIYFWDLILFIFFPAVVAIFMTCTGVEFKELISDIITAISILAGFLFNLLAIIYTSLEKLKIEKSEIKKKFILELHSNISYNILVSIFLICFLFLYKISIPKSELCDVLKKILIAINIFLLISFVLTLLMVLNRIYILLDSSKNDTN